MKKMCFITSALIFFTMLAGCSGERTTDVVENTPAQATEASYPMDAYGCVEVAYATEILKKKSADEALVEIESDLIDYYFLEEEKGMAIVDMHGIGMQKVVLQVYSTQNAGKTWELVEKNFPLLVGDVDCIFVKDKLLIANYAAAAEKISLFFVHPDGKKTYMQDEFFAKHQFDHFRLQTRLSYHQEEDTIVCTWFEDYDFDKVIYTTVYDGNMNLISQTKGE